MALSRGLSAIALQTLIRQQANKGLRPFWETFGEAWIGNALPGGTVGLRALQDGWGSSSSHARHFINASASCSPAIPQQVLFHLVHSVYAPMISSQIRTGTSPGIPEEAVGSLSGAVVTA